MFPSRRPTNEHKLAGQCSSVGKLNAVGNWPRREQKHASSFVSEASVPAWQEHHPNNRQHLLLRKLFNSRFLSWQITNDLNPYFSLISLFCNWFIGHQYDMYFIRYLDEISYLLTMPWPKLREVLLRAIYNHLNQTPPPECSTKMAAWISNNLWKYSSNVRSQSSE